jgi:hypothetical protein
VSGDCESFLKGAVMKKKMLFLLIMVCSMVPSTWADTPARTVTGASQTGSQTAVLKHLTTQTNGSTVAKQNEAPKVGEKQVVGSAGGPLDNQKHSGLLWLVAAMPSFVFLAFLLKLSKGLQKSGWSLRDALSESEPVKGPNGQILTNPITGEPVYARSASRLMAFIGFFVTTIWLMGFLIPTLYHFAYDGKVPPLSDVSTFLLAQAGMFAPYIANKLSGAIKS